MGKEINHLISFFYILAPINRHPYTMTKLSPAATKIINRITIIAGVLVLIIFILACIFEDSADKRVPEKIAFPLAKTPADYKREAKEELKRWYYSTDEDKMTSTTVYTARKHATEKITTGGHWEDHSTTTTTSRKTKTTTSKSATTWAPNDGYMMLCLQSRTNKKTGVFIYSTTGTLPVNFKTVRIRFDKNEAKSFNITPVSFASQSIDGFSITSSGEFMTSLMKATTVLVEIGGALDENKEVFTFQVAGLEWTHQ